MTIADGMAGNHGSGRYPELMHSVIGMAKLTEVTP